MSKIEILRVINEDERVEIFNNEGIKTTIDILWDRIFTYVFVP